MDRGIRSRRRAAGHAPGAANEDRRHDRTRPRDRWTRWRSSSRPGRTCLRLNFSHGTRDEHAENIEMARRASELAGRQVGVPRLTCPAQSCASTRSRAALSSSTGARRGDAHNRRGGRGRGPPPRVMGRAALGGSTKARKIYLADGRGPTSGLEHGAREDPVRGRGRWPGRLAPGPQRARDRRAASGRKPQRTWIGSTSQ